MGFMGTSRCVDGAHTHENCDSVSLPVASTEEPLVLGQDTKTWDAWEVAAILWEHLMLVGFEHVLTILKHIILVIVSKYNII